MEQVYTPTVIADTPFPQTDQLQPNPTQQTSNQTYGQQTIQASSFPEPVIAQELLSTALNTRSKKIIQEFQFAQSGALQIGDYTQGVNGDIRISPTGITARDLAGNTTFDLDGDTGEAIFKGKVQAADFVIADENGLVSASVFQADSYHDTSTITQPSTFSGTDVSGSTLKLTLVRPAHVLLTFFANVSMTPIDGLVAYHVNVWVDIDGDGGTNGTAVFSTQGVNNASGGVTLGSCLAFSKVVLLPQGFHTLKLRWSAFSDNTVTMKERGFSYCMLGS